MVKDSKWNISSPNTVLNRWKKAKKNVDFSLQMTFLAPTSRSSIEANSRLTSKGNFSLCIKPYRLIAVFTTACHLSIFHVRLPKPCHPI